MKLLPSGRTITQIRKLHGIIGGDNDYDDNDGKDDELIHQLNGLNFPYCLLNLNERGEE